MNKEPTNTVPPKIRAKVRPIDDEVGCDNVDESRLRTINGVDRDNVVGAPIEVSEFKVELESS